MNEGLYGKVLKTIEDYVGSQGEWDGYYYGIRENGKLVKVPPPVHANCRCMIWTEK